MSRMPPNGANFLVRPSQESDSGWDSSLDRLWSMEQQAEVGPVLLSPGETIQQRGVDQTSTLVDDRAAASQRKVHNRKLAQRRYRQRQKASTRVTAHKLLPTSRRLLSQAFGLAGSGARFDRARKHTAPAAAFPKPAICAGI